MSPMTTPVEPIEPEDQHLRRALVTVALHSAIIAIALFLLFPGPALTIRLFRQQDFIVLLTAAALLLLLAWRRPQFAGWTRVSAPITVAALSLELLDIARAWTRQIFYEKEKTTDEAAA